MGDWVGNGSGNVDRAGVRAGKIDGKGPGARERHTGHGRAAHQPLWAVGP